MNKIKGKECDKHAYHIQGKYNTKLLDFGKIQPHNNQIWNTDEIDLIPVANGTG